MIKIRVAFCNFWPNFIPKEDIFYTIINSKYKLIEDYRNPDLIIYSVFNKGISHKFYNSNINRIFYTGENLSPDKFTAGYNNIIKFSYNETRGNNFYFPLWQKFCMENTDFVTDLNNKIRVNKFNEFCSFSVSNPNSVDRNNIYNKINSYKKVKSYGKYANNDKLLLDFGNTPYWHNIKINEFRKHTHKFNICYENTCNNGYITEKIMDSYLCGSIPIYKGANNICDHFNEKSFINCNNINNDEILDYIKYIDNNENEFHKIYNEKVFTDNQIEQYTSNMKNVHSSILDFL